MSSLRTLADTNVLVYSTFEDSDKHEEAMRLLSQGDVVIPRIVVYEFIWVLAKLTNDLDLVRRKVEELRDFHIVTEELEDMIEGVKILNDDRRTFRMINDYVILALAKRLKLKLMTYDEGLRKVAKRHGVEVLDTDFPGAR
jgi:predicted nucleic acid-binding protein